MAEDRSGIVRDIVNQFGVDRGRLMDIIRAIHGRFGHLSNEDVAVVAEALAMRPVEIRDTASFYAFFSQQPQGKHVIRLCHAVVERMHGADELGQAFEEACGCSFGETSPDGEFSLYHTACIGMSDQPPSALVNETPLVNLKPSDAPKIVEHLRKGGAVGELPQSEIDLNLRKSGDVVFSPMTRGAAIRASVNKTPEEVINEVTQARLRGRGGAGFPTGMKWNFCRQNQAEKRYLICNADEGEPGTFKDRVILTEQADLVFEGMTVAGYAIGATEGLLYLRGEYSYLLPHLERVLERRRGLGLLGDNISGCENFSFDIRIQLGAGAYICGEESALISSLEGKRGAPRDRPPFPVQKGYGDMPSSVNNVETLCAAARILERGADWFRGLGEADSTGTKVLSISGDCQEPGVYEVEYGVSVEKVLEMVGAEEAQGVQIGGPSGLCLAPKDFGRVISFEDVPTGGSFIVFGRDCDLLECMRQFMEFFVEESCGWCVPCRAGTTILLKEFDKILEGKGTQADLDTLEEHCQTVKTMSRCGLGQTAPNPILSSMRNFPRLYQGRLQEEEFTPRFDFEKAVAAGAQAANRAMPHVEE
jgi:[NiFe] hydrogenase diaphorase moiety large subunit